MNASTHRWGRRFLGAALAVGTVTACGGNAAAPDAAAPVANADHQETELVFAGVGGQLGATYAKILDRFGEERGVKVTYVEQDVPTSFSKMSAQVAANQVQYDVVMLNDVSGAQAKARGITAPIDPDTIPSLADLPDYVYPGQVDGPFTAFSVVGIAYDPAQFQANGWTPPETWEDFVDPTYAHCIALPDPVKAGSGQLGLALVNQAVGDGYEDIDALLEAIGPNASKVPAITGALSQSIQLMSQGTVCMGLGTQGLALNSSQSGSPVEFVVPQNTSSQGLPLVIPRGAEHPNLALEFIDFVLQEPAQQTILDEALWTPVREGIEAQNDVSKSLVRPEEFDEYNVQAIPPETFSDSAEWGRKFGQAFGQ